MIVWYGRAARLDRARDGEARAAVLQRDPGAGCDDTRAERLEQALDEGDGHPVLVDRAEVDGAARRLGDRRLDAAPAAVEVGRVDQPGDVGAVTDAGEAVLERELHAADATREAR